jgi:polyhydroxyalkanoate synthesis regulator phasin
MNDTNYDAARIAELTANAIESAVSQTAREAENLINDQERTAGDLVAAAEDLLRALKKATDEVNERTRSEMQAIIQEMRQHSDRLAARVTEFIKHCDESVNKLRSQHTNLNGGGRRFGPDEAIKSPKAAQLPPVEPLPSFMTRPRRHDDDSA